MVGDKRVVLCIARDFPDKFGSCASAVNNLVLNNKEVCSLCVVVAVEVNSVELDKSLFVELLIDYAACLCRSVKVGVCGFKILVVVLNHSLEVAEELFAGKCVGAGYLVAYIVGLAAYAESTAALFLAVAALVVSL